MALNQQLLNDFPTLSQSRITAAAETYVLILREELAVDVPTIREKLNALASIRTEENTARIVQRLNQFIEQLMPKQNNTEEYVPAEIRKAANGLISTDPTERQRSVKNLTEMMNHHDKAYQELVTALDNSYPDVHIRAAVALAWKDEPRAASRLIELLETGYAFVDEKDRQTAVEALRRIKDRSADGALTKTLQDDKSKNVRRAAVKAIGRNMGSEAIPVLAKALKDDRDSDVRYAIVVALESIEGNDVESALSIALDDPENKVAIKAAQLLGERGNTETSIDELTRLLRDYTPNISYIYHHKVGKELAVNAAWALGEIVDNNASELSQEVILNVVLALTEHLNPDTPQFGGALMRIGYNETARKIAISELAKFLNDENSSSQAAINAIIFLDGKYPFTDFDNPDKAKEYAFSLVEKEVKDRKNNKS